MFTCSCSMHCLLPFTMFCKCCWCIFKAVARPRVRNSSLKILLLRAIFIIHRKIMQFNSLTLLNKGQASEVHQMSKCVWVSGFCWGQMKDRGKQIRKTTKCQYISKLCVSSDSGTWMDIPYVLYISRIISLFVALSLQKLPSLSRVIRPNVSQVCRHSGSSCWTPVMPFYSGHSFTSPLSPTQCSVKQPLRAFPRSVYFYMNWNSVLERCVASRTLLPSLASFSSLNLHSCSAMRKIALSWWDWRFWQSLLECTHVANEWNWA